MIDSLKELFIEELKDLYHAERQLLDALPRIKAGATSAPLKDALDFHLTETANHVTRLEEVFSAVKERPAERTCRAMAGLIAEADEMLKECASPEVRDAAIVASTQRIQHYEMAGYGSARTHAKTLGETKAAKILQQTLDEEGAMDHALTDIAQGRVNPQAVTA